MAGGLYRATVSVQDFDNHSTNTAIHFPNGATYAQYQSALLVFWDDIYQMIAPASATDSIATILGGGLSYYLAYADTIIVDVNTSDRPSKLSLHFKSMSTEDSANTSTVTRPAKYMLPLLNKYQQDASSNYLILPGVSSPNPANIDFQNFYLWFERGNYTPSPTGIVVPSTVTNLPLNSLVEAKLYHTSPSLRNSGKAQG